MILCVYLVHYVSFLKRFVFCNKLFYSHGINFLRFRNKSYFALKNSCTHLQADNRVLVMPRGPLDILKKVLGMHAQVVTKPFLAN